MRKTWIGALVVLALGAAGAPAYAEPDPAPLAAAIEAAVAEGGLTRVEAPAEASAEEREGFWTESRQERASRLLRVALVAAAAGVIGYVGLDGQGGDDEEALRRAGYYTLAAGGVGVALAW